MSDDTEHGGAGQHRSEDVYMHTAIARLEGKIDGLACGQATLRELMTGFDARLRALEVDVADIEGRATQASQSPQWPAVVSALVAAGVALLALVALVYDRGGTP